MIIALMMRLPHHYPNGFVRLLIIYNRVRDKYCTKPPAFNAPKVIGPASEWHEKTSGSSLHQTIDMPEPTLPRHQMSQRAWQARSSARASQDITDHHIKFTWQQDTTLPSPEQAAQFPWHHETPRPQRKSLSSYDPFITCKICSVFYYFIH